MHSCNVKTQICVTRPPCVKDGETGGHVARIGNVIPKNLTSDNSEKTVYKIQTYVGVIECSFRFDVLLVRYAGGHKLSSILTNMLRRVSEILQHKMSDLKLLRGRRDVQTGME